MNKERWWAGAVILAVAIAGGVFIWLRFQQPALPEGFASGNGRIEATEIDVATQWAGRVKEVLASEGDLVDADQVVARMDTAIAGDTDFFAGVFGQVIRQDGF
jgi:HlyD family secretion protein